MLYACKVAKNCLVSINRGVLFILTPELLFDPSLSNDSVSHQLSTCTYYWHQVYQILAVRIWRINGTGVPKCPFTSRGRRSGSSQSLSIFVHSFSEGLL